MWVPCLVDRAAVNALLVMLVKVIILPITLATHEPHNANAPEEAGILSLSAARSRIEDSLQTAWPGSYHPEERKVVRD